MLNPIGFDTGQLAKSFLLCLGQLRSTPRGRWRQRLRPSNYPAHRIQCESLLREFSRALRFPVQPIPRNLPKPMPGRSNRSALPETDCWKPPVLRSHHQLTLRREAFLKSAGTDRGHGQPAKRDRLLSQTHLDARQQPRQTIRVGQDHDATSIPADHTAPLELVRV